MLLDFLGYMFFSALEYFAIFLLIFTFFNLYPRHYKSELFVITLVSTFISYILTVTKIMDVIPAPVFAVPVITLSVFIAIHKKLFYSFVISTAGYLLYALVQSLIAMICVHYNFLTIENLSDSFTVKTYFVQSLSSILGIAIALYTALSKGGFGFSFRKGNFKKFVTVTLIMFVNVGYVFYIFTHKESFSALLLVASAFLVSVLILFYLSYERDNYEIQ